MHDIGGASMSGQEFATIQSSVLSALETIIGMPIAIDLLLSPIAYSPSAQQVQGSGNMISGALRDAMRLYYSGRTAQAEQIALNIVSRDADNATARHLLGLCLKKEDSVPHLGCSFNIRSAAHVFSIGH